MIGCDDDQVRLFQCGFIYLLMYSKSGKVTTSKVGIIGADISSLAGE